MTDFYETDTFKIKVVGSSPGFPKSLEIEYFDKLLNTKHIRELSQNDLPKNVKNFFKLSQFRDTLLHLDTTKFIKYKYSIFNGSVTVEFSFGLGLAKTEFHIQLYPIDNCSKFIPVPLKLAPLEPLKLAPLEPLKLAPLEPLKLAPLEPLKLAPLEPLKLAPVIPEPPLILPNDDIIYVFKKIDDFKIEYTKLMKFGIENGIFTKYYSEKEFKLEDMTFDTDTFDRLKNMYGKPVLEEKVTTLEIAARFIIPPLKQVIVTKKEMRYLDHHYPKMFDTKGFMTCGYHFNDGTVKFKELKKCEKQTPRLGGNYHPRLDKSDWYIEKGIIFKNLVKSYVQSKGYNFVYDINGIEKTVKIDGKIYYTFMENMGPQYNIYILKLSDPSIRIISTKKLTLLLDNGIKTNDRNMIYLQYYKRVNFTNQNLQENQSITR